MGADQHQHFFILSYEYMYQCISTKIPTDKKRMKMALINEKEESGLDVYFSGQLRSTFIEKLTSSRNFLLLFNFILGSPGKYWAHPHLQENYTEVETTPLWKYFFCRFLLRDGIPDHLFPKYRHCLDGGGLTPVHMYWGPSKVIIYHQQVKKGQPNLGNACILGTNGPASHP